MFDDFFVRALVAGIGIALVAGPLGCFVVWRRLSYFGDTLAHSAVLGVSLAIFLEINIIATVFLIAILISLLLLFLQKKGGLASDALLGLMSHSALALGLVAIAFMTWVRIDLNALLFGDILSVSRLDITVVWAGGILVMVLYGFNGVDYCHIDEDSRRTIDYCAFDYSCCNRKKSILKP